MRPTSAILIGAELRYGPGGGALAIRHVVVHGNLAGLRLALGHLSAERARVWLIDDPSPAVNPNLDFVLNDAAAALGRLR